MARRVGVSILLPMLLQEEGREVKGYLSLYRESPDGVVGPTALTLAKESKEHAETLASISGADGEPWHKTGAGGFLRNVVYGFNDGLTANFGLVAGMIGAQGDLARWPSHAVVVAGLAGAAADALSMGSSGYLAAKSEREVFEHEIAMEKEEIRLMPDLEQEELSLLYQAKGIPTQQAEALAAQIMQDPARALEEQVREELKIGEATSTPMREAWVTGIATALGAMIPVAPLLFDTGPVAIWTSFALAMLSPLRRRRGAQLLHRPRHLPERARHVPRGPRRGRPRLPAGRLDRAAPVIRWGLCCQFLDAPIKYRTATHRYVATLDPAARREYLASIAANNAAALADSVRHCRSLGIGAFRINSQVLPLGTHPVSGYTLDHLDRDGAIRRTFLEAGALARELGVRLSFHPDQFVVLNSEREAVVKSSLGELEFQAEIAELVGADVIVLHGGGGGGRGAGGARPPGAGSAWPERAGAQSSGARER